MGTLFTDKREYHTESGIVIKLKKIPSMQFARLQTDRRGAPLVPIVDVTIGGIKRMQENPDDPGYVLRLAEWERDRSLQMMTYTLAKGTEIEEDEQYKAWLADNQTFYPNASPLDLKVYYLYEVLTEDESKELFEEIIAQTSATMKGVADAASRFPTDDKSNGSE